MTLKTGKSAGMVMALIVALTLSLMYLGNTRLFEVPEEKTGTWHQYR